MTEIRKFSHSIAERLPVTGDGEAARNRRVLTLVRSVATDLSHGGVLDLAEADPNHPHVLTQEEKLMILDELRQSLIGRPRRGRHLRSLGITDRLLEELGDETQSVRKY